MGIMCPPAIPHISINRIKIRGGGVITLNGNTFAANDKEFKKLGHCNGYYRVHRRSVSILDPQKKKVGVINCHGVLACATLLDDGSYWYNYDTIKVVGTYQSYTQSVEEPMAVLKQFGINPIN